MIKGEENKFDFSKKHKQSDVIADESATNTTQNETENRKNPTENDTADIPDTADMPNTADNHDLLNQNSENQKSIETNNNKKEK